MSPAMRAAERRAYVVQRRAERVPFAIIGAELGVSAQRAHQLWRAALAAIPAAAVAEHRAEEIHLSDIATTELLAIARDTSAPHRTRVEAWHALRGWSEHRTRLLGLAAPNRLTVEVLTNDVVERAIAQLERDIAALDATP
jgi:hypothetical protein